MPIRVMLPGTEQPGLPDNLDVGLDSYAKDLVVVR
jgi:hypothetical protein